MLLPQMILKNCDPEASNAIYSLILFYMSFVCRSYVIHMYSYVPVCHSYVLVCSPHVTRMYSYVTRLSLVCHPYFTRLWFYNEPSKIVSLKCRLHFMFEIKTKRGLPPFTHTTREFTFENPSSVL